MSAPKPFSYSKFSDVLQKDTHKKHPYIDFDWETIDCNEDQRIQLQQAAEELGLKYAAGLLRQLAKYFCEGGRSRVGGAGLRAFIFAWFVDPELHGLSQTELAVLMDRKHKQSVGREVTKFRDLFGVLNQHMHSDEARAICRKREKSKRLDSIQEAS